MTTSIPIVCDLSVLAPQQRDRLADLAGRVLSRADHVQVLEHGYALRFADASDDVVVELAEFIALDRRCCAYMRHALVGDAGPGATWLELTGPPGASVAIAADVGRFVPDDVFAAASPAPRVDQSVEPGPGAHGRAHKYWRHAQVMSASALA